MSLPNLDRRDADTIMVLCNLALRAMDVSDRLRQKDAILRIHKAALRIKNRRGRRFTRKPRTLVGP